MDEFIYEKKNALPSDTCKNIIIEYNKLLNDTGNIDLFLSSVYNTELTNIQREILTVIDSELKKYYSLLNNDIYFFNIVHNKLLTNKITLIKHLTSQKFTESIYPLLIDNKNSTVLCFIYFLNTIEEGGEILICNKYKITPEEGKLVIFPSEWFFPYKYLNTPRAERYLISGLLYVNKDNITPLCI